MYIDLDENDLIIFFESKPIVIGEIGAGFLIYTIEKNNFKLTLSISIYEKECSISIEYGGKLISNRYLSEVEAIKYNGINLSIYCKDVEKITYISVLQNIMVTEEKS